MFEKISIVAFLISSYKSVTTNWCTRTVWCFPRWGPSITQTTYIARFQRTRWWAPVMVISVSVITLFKSHFDTISAQSRTCSVYLRQDPSITDTCQHTRHADSFWHYERTRTTYTHIVRVTWQTVGQVTQVTKIVTVQDGRWWSVTGCAGDWVSAGDAVRRTSFAESRSVDEVSSHTSDWSKVGQNVSGPGRLIEDVFVVSSWL